MGEFLYAVFKEVPLALLIIIACFSLIILFYYLYFFLRIHFWKPKKSTFKPPVSIIVCARNEENNLMNFLPKLLAQEYPNFEVVVVNDRSWDKSLDILTAYQVKHKDKLKIVNLDEDHINDRGKKLALTIGIKAARYEHLLLTDADCYPESNQWISRMMEGYEDGENSMVLGYSPFEKHEGFLNKLIRTDGFFVAFNYLSFALAGVPYMGVGRNMSYTKSLYFKSGGFRTHYHIRSGDDDLFVNSLKKVKIGVALHEDSFVKTIPATSLKQWAKQKQRHFTTAVHYRFLHRFLLALYPTALFGFLISLFPLFVYENGIYIAIAFFMTKSLFQMLIFMHPMKKLKQRDLIVIFPFLEYINLFLQSFNYIRQSQYKPIQWN